MTRYHISNLKRNMAKGNCKPALALEELYFERNKRYALMSEKHKMCVGL